MTDFYLIRGMKTVGTVTTDPYDYEYKGNDKLVKVVLEEGPPETRMTSADDDVNADIHTDRVEELDTEERFAEFEADLAAVGVEMQAKPEM